MAAGLHKHAQKLIPPDQHLDKETENDLFGIFYNILATLLRGNPSFCSLITSRIQNTEYQKFLDCGGLRAPRKSESKSAGDAEVTQYSHIYVICLLLSIQCGRGGL